MTEILQTITDTLSSSWIILSDNLPVILPSLVIALLLGLFLTPFIPKLAYKLGAIDLPGKLRSRTDKTAERRIHTNATPKLGGLAMSIALIASLLLTENPSLRPGIILGIVIITIVGILDDIYELSGKWQLLGQVLAAVVVVLSGVTLTYIQIAGIHIDLTQIAYTLDLGFFSHEFFFPADLISILWIVGMINIINWVGGIDGLNGFVSAVIALAMLVLSVQSGNILLAGAIAAFLGSILGVLAYNYPPAHIFYGSAGDFLNGFLIAVFSILQLSKMTTAVIIIGLPLIDALIVILVRIWKNPKILSKPWRLLEVSDKNHFHHRLMAAGFGVKSVLAIEVSITLILSVLALSLSSINTQYILLLGSVVALIAIFAFLAVGAAYVKNRQAEIEANAPKEAEVKIREVGKEEKPEDRYAY